MRKRQKLVDTVRCRVCGATFHAENNDITYAEISHWRFHEFNPLDESLYPIYTTV